jgi:hypothetical protein
MRKLLSSVAVVFAMSASTLLADEPVDVVGGLKKILTEQMQKQREAAGSMAKMREAFAARKTAVEALVKQAEDADPTKLSGQQQAALASACMPSAACPMRSSTPRWRSRPTPIKGRLHDADFRAARSRGR